MPRFNFSSYISKNSLTDFSSLNGLHPQADWEDKQKKTSGKPSMSQASTTSSEIDRQLVSEINQLTGGSYTLEDLGLGTPGDMSGDENRAENTDIGVKGEGFLALENIEVERLQQQDSFHSTEINQSAVHTQRANDIYEQTEYYPSTSGKLRTMSAPSPNFETEEKLSQTPRKRAASAGDEDTTKHVTCKPKAQTTVKEESVDAEAQMPQSHVVSYEPLQYSNGDGTKSQHVAALVYLDGDNILRPVRNTNEIKSLVHVSKPEVLPPAPWAVEDALKRLQNIPVEQVTHFAHIGDFVRHLQANERICDVTVHIGTERYAAHRICLACYSDYFADIFYSRGEKQRVPLTVRLKGIKPVAFEILLKYIYTGSLDVNPDVVGDLMTMAESLRIPMVKTRVVDYLECQPLADALTILMKEKIFGPLYDRAMIAVCEQFNTFRHELVFLDIDIETLVIILSSDNLNITSELDVFNGAVRWISHDVENRRQHLLRLMKCVRFAHMTHLELFQCNELTDLMKSNHDCRQMLLDANWIATARLLCKEDPCNLVVPKCRIATLPEPLKSNDDVFYGGSAYKNLDVEVNSPVETPRSPKDKPQKTDDIIAVGGFNPPSSRSAVCAKAIDRYHTKRNEWQHYCDLPEPRLHYAVTIQNGKLYLTGGTDPRLKVKHPVPTNDAFVYDIKGNAWIKVMSMNSARMYHSLCALYGMIYAIGGQGENNSVLNTIECYNPATDNWFFVKSMKEARLGAGTGILDGKLFVVGGYGEIISTKSGNPVLDSVESFDPRANRWTTMNQLRFPRCHCDIVTVNGVMYLCGGATRSYTSRDSVISSTSSIDMYIKDLDIWEHCSDMVVARHDAGTAAVGDLIYIIGGASTQSNRILRSVECFDTATGTWISGVQDLPYPSKWIRCLSVAFADSK